MQLCAECRRIIKLWFLFAVIFYVISKGYDIPVALFMLLAGIALFASMGFWAAIIEVFTIFLPVLVLYFITVLIDRNNINVIIKIITHK